MVVNWEVEERECEFEVDVERVERWERSWVSRGNGSGERGVA